MNPAYLVCDSSALIQLLIAGEKSLISTFRTRFRMRLGVVPEVTQEIRGQEGIARSFEQRMKSGDIVQLTLSELDHYARDLNLNISSKTIMVLGKQLNQFVDLGEAFSHAVAAAFRLPMLTNDWSAVRALTKHDCGPIGFPVIGLVDVLCCFFDGGILSDEQCSGILGRLKQAGEVVPGVLSNPARAFAERRQEVTDWRLKLLPPGRSATAPKNARDVLWLELLDPGY